LRKDESWKRWHKKDCYKSCAEVSIDCREIWKEEKRNLFPKYRRDKLKKRSKGHQNTAALNVALCLVGFRVTVCVTDVTPSAYT